MSDRVKKCTTPNTIPICVYKSVFSSIQYLRKNCDAEKGK